MNKIEEWLEEIDCEGELVPITADASLRKYFRLKSSMHSGIVMDSSEQKESLAPFLDMNLRLYEANVRVPKIFTYNKKEGLVFMEDLGSAHLFEKVEEGDFETYYDKAIETIIKMQNTDTEDLPAYDADFLHFEMDLMQEWYLEKYLGVTLDDTQQNKLSDALAFIASQVLSQPQGVFVHRDYHSRNIMLSPCNDEIVVIDYQDARVGAITYDLVSLLRDVYVELDSSVVESMALRFRDSKGLDVDDARFMRWFDFMGLQRHIKILGIFSRLALRDGKEGYLKDIPLTLKYVLEIASKYPETQDLAKMLKSL
ncbi:MAG: phosphotransferase [Campylobacterota bacterium]|nr:phosphotransferase [Campylobacterota bacterium]